MKPTLLFRGPVKTRSGYGSHSRDLLESLYQMDMFDIKIDSCGWGTTPMTALQIGNPFHQWVEQGLRPPLPNARALRQEVPPGVCLREKQHQGVIVARRARVQVRGFYARYLVGVNLRNNFFNTKFCFTNAVTAKLN